MKISILPKFVCLLLTVSLITSCAVTEQLWVEKQGSGRYEMSMDMGGMIGFLSMMDTVETDTPKEKEVMDTVMSFASIYEENDSIDMSVITRPELLDKVTLGMHIDEEKEIMDIKVMIDFDSFEEADEILKEIAKLKSVSDGAEKSGNPASPESVLGMLDESGLGFAWSKGKLSREAQTMDDDDLSELGEMEEGEMQMMKGMLGNMEYKTIIHLPGKVKKVSDPNGVIKNNMVEFTYSLADILESKEYGGFEIRYK